jgi:hypothetical protein
MSLTAFTVYSSGQEMFKLVATYQSTEPKRTVGPIIELESLDKAVR